MGLYPRHDLGAQPAWPSAIGVQVCQVNDDVHLATHQVAMRRAMVALAHFQPVFVAAKALLHLLHVLKRNQAKRGIATICIGGGLGGAMLVESLN